MALAPIRMGSSFERVYAFQTDDVPRNLAGSTFVFKIRGRSGMLTFSGGAIAVNNAAGTVTVNLSGSQTNTLFENNAAESYLVETIGGTDHIKARLYERILTPTAPGDLPASDEITIEEGSEGDQIFIEEVETEDPGGGPSYFFANSNGVSFGTNGSTVTASVNSGGGDFSASSLLRALSADSQLQFTSANSNFLGSAASGSFLGSAASESFRATSQNSQLQFTSANSNFLGSGATASFRHTSADTQLQFTSANSNFLGTGATVSFQHTSVNSLSLGTEATASFRHTSADTQLQFTSANSNFLGTAATQSFQFTSVNSLSLGTGATASFRHTSADSQLQFTSANSNFLGTAATASFQHTSAMTNFIGSAATASFRHTSADSQLRFTSADTNLQFTSAFQSLGISNAGNTSGTSGMASGSAPQIVFAGGNNITLSQSLNGSQGTITISAGAAAPSPVIFSAGGEVGTLGSLVFSNSNGVSFGLNGSTLTASAAGGAAGPTISSYQNMPGLINSSALTFQMASISQAVAFNLPQNGSFGILRLAGLMTTNSTTIATLASATASASGALYSTLNAVVYSMGTGASSRSLQSVASGSGGFTISQAISVTNSTQYSVSQGVTFQASGSTTQHSTQYSISNTNYSFSTNAIATMFSSGRFLDIPFAHSLPAGPHWLIVGGSSSSVSGGAAGLAAMTNANVRYSAHYGASQVNAGIGVMGSTNMASGGQLGNGFFSTAGGGTTASLPLSAISSTASNPIPFFQLLR